jgi:hypothetical protein
MASGTCKALWVGPYEGELPDKTVLIPGKTVVEILTDEAEGSDNWKPATAAQIKAYENSGEGDDKIEIVVAGGAAEPTEEELAKEEEAEEADSGSSEGSDD